MITAEDIIFFSLGALIGIPIGIPIVKFIVKYILIKIIRGE